MKYFESLIFYFQMFTAIPINYAVEEPTERYQQGIFLFPLFGFLYGSLLAIIYGGLSFVLPIHLVWLLVIFCDVLLTNGFHHDALADMADGLFSSRKKTEMLEIMRDSRMGSNGTIALLFYFAIIYFFGTHILSQLGSLSDQLKWLLATVTVSRGGLCFMFRSFVYSGHTRGLGTIIEGIDDHLIIVAQFIATGLVYFLTNWIGAVIYGWTLICLEAYRRFVYRRVDGLNGDTTGAAAMISQIVWVITYACLI